MISVISLALCVLGLVHATTSSTVNTGGQVEVSDVGSAHFFRMIVADADPRSQETVERIREHRNRVGIWTLGDYASMDSVLLVYRCCMLARESLAATPDDIAVVETRYTEAARKNRLFAHRALFIAAVEELETRYDLQVSALINEIIAFDPGYGVLYGVNLEMSSIQELRILVALVRRRRNAQQ